MRSSNDSTIGRQNTTFSVERLTARFFVPVAGGGAAAAIITLAAIETSRWTFALPVTGLVIASSWAERRAP